MDIDYSKFECNIGKIELSPYMGIEAYYYWVVVFDKFHVISTIEYTTKRAAIRGAKRAIKRIVETAVGDK